MAGLDSTKLELVFQSRPDILEGIRTAADSPKRVALFNNIAEFVYEKLGDPTSSEPAPKRRRVDVASSQNGTTSNGLETSSAEDVAKETILLEIKDISVTIPQRKKFDICITAQHIFCRRKGNTDPEPGMIYAWKDVEYAFHLPVPEKAAVQYNYILFPRGSCLQPLSKAGSNTTEPLVFTVSSAAPKPDSIGGPNAAAASAVSDSYITLFDWAINKCLQARGNDVKITKADPSKFHSVKRQSQRPKEKAVHVSGFMGSKDGYLFFLENGILWGFKKPMMFIPLDRIAAVSYTNVLQRTFNMAVEVFTNEGGDSEATEEVEFAMLDQEDYPGINEDYVMKKRLQDRSLADQRRAKIELAENAKGGKKGANDADGEANSEAAGDGMTELERAKFEAEQQLQDEEDEDEEDYDPGSDGDSEGSGTSSEEDDDDDDEDEGDDEMDDEGAEE